MSALNCAEEKNAPVCREHEIDAFPTLRVLGAISNDVSVESIPSFQYFKLQSKDKKDSAKFEGDKKNMDILSGKVASWVKEDYDVGKPLNWPHYDLINA